VRESTDKPDAYLTIEQGSEVREARRLEEILVKVDGVLVRSTTSPTRRTRLEPLPACLDYAVRLGRHLRAPPVTFQYAAADNAFSNYVTWTPSRTDIRKFDKPNNDTIGDTFDVNGDGFPDIVRYDVDAKDHWDVWLHTADGYPSGAGDNVDYAVPSGWAIRNNDVTLSDQSPNTKTAPMDFNADGYVDFLRADGDGLLEFRLNNGSAFASSTTAWNLAGFPRSSPASTSGTSGIPMTEARRSSSRASWTSMGTRGLTSSSGRSPVTCGTGVSGGTPGPALWIVISGGSIRT